MTQKLWEGNMVERKRFDTEEEFAGLDFHSIIPQGLNYEPRRVRTFDPQIKRASEAILNTISI
jgi:hypothetical protein